MKHKTVTITMVDSVGTFAENKDIARKIRRDEIIPNLRQGASVILDFAGVTAVTQSFIHALIIEVIRDFGLDVLDRMVFRSCNEVVKNIVSIVIDYMQAEGEGEEDAEV